MRERSRPQSTGRARKNRHEAEGSLQVRHLKKRMDKLLLSADLKKKGKRGEAERTTYREVQAGNQPGKG